MERDTAARPLSYTNSLHIVNLLESKRPAYDKNLEHYAACSAAPATAVAPFSPKSCASVQDHHPDGELHCFALLLLQKDL